MSNKIILNSIRLLKKCPACNSEYDEKTARILERSREDGILIHFSCPKCYNSSIAQIVETPFGAIGSAILTDLQAEEVLKFKNNSVVTIDDALAVYEKLEKKQAVIRDQESMIKNSGK